MTAVAQTLPPEQGAHGLAHPAAAELLRGWVPDPVVPSDRLGFWAGWFTGLTILLGVIFPQLPLHDIDQAKAVVRDVVTMRLLEPPPIPEKPKPKPEPKPVVQVKAPVKPKPEPVLEKPIPVTVVEETAVVVEEEAPVDEMLQFKELFAGLRTPSDSDTVPDAKIVQRGTGEAAQLERSVVTLDNHRSDVAYVHTQASVDAGGIAMAGQQRSRVEALAGRAGGGRSVRNTRVETPEGARSIEDIRRVFDANKGQIFALYNRALRQDAALRGKVVLELTIAQSGAVQAVVVVASELEAPVLLDQLLERVRRFDFGTHAAASTVVTYPIHFLPS